MLDSYSTSSMKIQDKLYGNFVEYLHSNHIFFGWIPTTIFGLYVYFVIIKKYRGWKSNDWYDRLGIVGFIIMLLLSLFMQITMLVRENLL